MVRTLGLALVLAAFSSAAFAAAPETLVKEGLRFDNASSASFEMSTWLEAAPAVPQADFVRSHATPGADLYDFSSQKGSIETTGWWPWPGSVTSPYGYTVDKDVPAAVADQLAEDLKFMGSIQGGAGTPLHRKIFGAVDGPNYVKFFTSRVTAVGISGCGSANAVACVIPFRNPSKMWLTQNYIRFSHPQIARQMVVFHESRHTESRNGNWPHASCPTPFLGPDGQELKSIWTGASLAGEPACDETPFGSYGSSTIMLKNIQKSCLNCSDKVKMDAGLYADDQLNRIIDAGARREMEEDFQK